MIPIWRADGYCVRLVFLSLPDAETAISRKEEIYNRTTVIAAETSVGQSGRLYFKVDL
jgi:hypothetical protein